MYDNKILLRVNKDNNGWYNFSKGKFRLQLCGDTRKDGFFLEQYANKLGKKDFMRDLTDILKAMEEDKNQPIFTLYELPEVLKWENKK